MIASNMNKIDTGPFLYYVRIKGWVDGPENSNFPLLYVVKSPYVGGWVVQKSLKTPLRNTKMAPSHDDLCIFLFIIQMKTDTGYSFCDRRIVSPAKQNYDS